MCRYFDFDRESSFCIVEFRGEIWDLNKALDSLAPQYNGSYQVAPRFPTVQRLLQSLKAALHKDM
jgi:hypothetical protein